MRTLMLLFSFTGCAFWSPTNTSELQASRHQQVLLVGSSEATEMQDVAAGQQGLEGVPVRRWSLRRGSSDPDLLLNTGPDPDELAEKMGWQPQPVPSGRVEVPMSDVEYARTMKPNNSLAVGLGLGTLGTVATILAVVFSTGLGVPCGRPLRVRGRRVVTPVERAGSDWSEPLKIQPVPEEVRPLLAEIWTEEAQAEHAAIAAFSKLSLELVALGAPPELVARSNRSAMQEVRHARLCFALASAYRGQPLSPGPLPAALEGDRADLFKLARESLVDGCMREGIAAEIARLGAERARDPEVARVLRIQARDEAQHAALAWDIVEWCIARGGDPVRCAALTALEQARLPRVDDLPEHGRVGRILVTPWFDALRERARQRLFGCLRAAA